MLVMHKWENHTKDDIVDDSQLRPYLHCISENITREVSASHGLENHTCNIQDHALNAAVREMHERCQQTTVSRTNIATQNWTKRPKGFSKSSFPRANWPVCYLQHLGANTSKPEWQVQAAVKSKQLSLTAYRCGIDLPVNSSFPIGVFLISADLYCHSSILIWISLVCTYCHSINWCHNSDVFLVISLSVNTISLIFTISVSSTTTTSSILQWFS